MPFNAIREYKILAKISGFTVLLLRAFVFKSQYLKIDAQLSSGVRLHSVALSLFQLPYFVYAGISCLHIRCNQKFMNMLYYS